MLYSDNRLLSVLLVSLVLIIIFIILLISFTSNIFSQIDPFIYSSDKALNLAINSVKHIEKKVSKANIEINNIITSSEPEVKQLISSINNTLLLSDCFICNSISDVNTFDLDVCTTDSKGHVAVNKNNCSLFKNPGS